MFDVIAKDLLKIEKPGRYIGNEMGIPRKDFVNAEVRMVLSYPDLYEIGMSNYGLKILYDLVNKIEFAACERVFSPWIDFEKYLQERNELLFSLETKTPINQFDILGVSIQYELLFSNFLALLQSGGITLRRAERTEKEPIVLLGGPGCVNPAPYAPFADLVVIGEGEEPLSNIVTMLRSLKERGASRQEKIEALAGIEGVYAPGVTKGKVKRQVYMGFSEYTGPDHVVIPLIDIVQNKLVVEIMRGCPNKCRFCQAGVIYKPYREKNTGVIMHSIEKGLALSGVNEVTFASLSSGDYSHIVSLTTYFNERYASKRVSVSLPSLKVESFDLDILDQISLVRKSGLTFAIESGSLEGQLSLNKRVNSEKIFAILDAAIKKGWKLVKFYFMLGLPDDTDDVAHIKTYVDAVRQRFPRLMINLNIAVFVPKPHTPYQRASQLSFDESIAKINAIREYYRKTRVSVKAHEPEMSYIEGFISRGDERIGYAVEKAFKRGARFDGWNDRFNFELYRAVFQEENITDEKYLRGSYPDGMPWDMIDPLVHEDFFELEKKRSADHEESVLCKEGCDPDCNICNNGIKTVDALDDFHNPAQKVASYEPGRYRYFLEFSKKGLARYLSHKDLMRYFETLFRIADIDLLMSEGFNPHPRFQFSSALSLGIESECEILEFYTRYSYLPEELQAMLNRIAIDNLKIIRLRKCVSDKKNSIYDTLYATEYLLKYDKVWYTEVVKLIDQYNKSNTHVLMDNDHSWDLKSIVSFENSTTENLLSMICKKTTPGPRVYQIVNAILNNIEIDIIKKRMYMRVHHENKDLFYME